jgi:hypothetical protein
MRKLYGFNLSNPDYASLYVGSQFDYENGNFENDKWSFVLAAKEPFHRQALGYAGRACDKANPEYLIAMRDNKLILNLVDAPRAEFFDKRIIDTALNYIEDQLNKGNQVLVVCNEGHSRSASIALLYLIKHQNIKGKTFEDYEAEFMKVYPEYKPGAGMRGFVKEHWKEYLF